MNEISTLSLFNEETGQNETYAIADETARSLIENGAGAIEGGNSIILYITATSTSVSIPSWYSDCLVDWGDGTATIGNTHNYTSLGKYTIKVSLANKTITRFNECVGLDITGILIPDSTKTDIDANAFLNCANLKSATIGNNIVMIGQSAFSGCVKLISVRIGTGISSISDYSFYNCSRLSEIFIPGNVKNIGISAFEGCSSLAKAVISNGVEMIYASAFRHCANLIYLTLSETLMYIGDYAFAWCSSLRFVPLPRLLSTLGKFAFYDCTALIEVTIGPFVMLENTSDTFSKCSNLRRVIFKDRWFEEICYPSNFLADTHSSIKFIFEDFIQANIVSGLSDWIAAWGDSSGDNSHRYAWITYGDMSKI